MEEKKFDMAHSNEVIEKMNTEIKKIEEKILEGKTPEEQEKIKKEWKQNKIETEQELKKEFEVFEKKQKKWNNNQNNLMSAEDIKTGLNDMVKDLDDKWNETLNSAIENLCKDKTLEERVEIGKKINNDNPISIVNLREKMRNAQFLLTYDNSSVESTTKIVIADDYIYTYMNNKINEYIDKDKTNQIKQVSLDFAKRIKQMEKEREQIEYYKDLLSDDINITTDERIYHLTGKVNDKKIKTEYINLVNSILKILEVK